MKERKLYIGTLNGVNGSWCDAKPQGLELKETITFYTADEGRVFADKDGNLVDSVVVKDGTHIDDYVEIIDIRDKKESEE